MTDDGRPRDWRRQTGGEPWFGRPWVVGAGPSREPTCLAVGFPSVPEMRGRGDAVLEQVARQPARSSRASSRLTTPWRCSVLSSAWRFPKSQARPQRICPRATQLAINNQCPTNTCASGANEKRLSGTNTTHRLLQVGIICLGGARRQPRCSCK